MFIDLPILLFFIVILISLLFIIYYYGKQYRKILYIILLLEISGFLLIAVDYQEHQVDKKISVIYEKTTVDNDYKIILKEYGEAQWMFQPSKVHVFVAKKIEQNWQERELFWLHIGGEGKDFKVQWIDNGAIIYLIDFDCKDTVYRVYWQDVFGDN